MSNELKNLRQRVAELESENGRLTSALEQSEELFRKIFHASSNMMAIHTIKEGKFVDVNEAARCHIALTLPLHQAFNNRKESQNTLR